MKSIKACMFALVVGCAVNCGANIDVSHKRESSQTSIAYKKNDGSLTHIKGELDDNNMYEFGLELQSNRVLFCHNMINSHYYTPEDLKRCGAELGQLIMEAIRAEMEGSLDISGARNRLANIIRHIPNAFPQEFIVSMVSVVLNRPADVPDLSMIVQNNWQNFGEITIARFQTRLTGSTPQTGQVFTYNCLDGGSLSSNLDTIVHGNLSLTGQLTNGNRVKLNGDKMTAELSQTPDGLEVEFNYGKVHPSARHANALGNFTLFAKTIQGLSQQDKARFAIACMRMLAIEDQMDTFSYLSRLSESLGVKFDIEQCLSILNGEMPKGLSGPIQDLAINTLNQVVATAFSKGDSGLAIAKGAGKGALVRAKGAGKGVVDRVMNCLADSASVVFPMVRRHVQSTMASTQRQNNMAIMILANYVRAVFMNGLPTFRINQPQPIQNGENGENRWSWELVERLLEQVPNGQERQNLAERIRRVGYGAHGAMRGFLGRVLLRRS